jgi:outer membrane protein assembly factor BamD (BamD/ComL family)
VGNKSGRTGKHVLFYFAVIIIIAALLNTVACAPVQDKIALLRAQQQLEQYRESMAAGFFETVIQQSEQVLAENETAPPADVALYILGEVYAHHDYQGRNYVLSQYYFEKLIENFPDSPLTSEAKTYVGLFETIAAEEKLTAAAEEKASLNKIIIETKKKSVPVSKSRKVVENQNFEEAVQENLQILQEVGKKKPADEALYNLGLIYAHVDNPAKDYKKSQIYFQTLIQQFPDSELAEEGRIWLGLFETIEKIQQIDIDIEQQKKELTR